MNAAGDAERVAAKEVKKFEESDVAADLRAALGQSPAIEADVQTAALSYDEDGCDSELDALLLAASVAAAKAAAVTAELAAAKAVVATAIFAADKAAADADKAAADADMLAAAVGDLPSDSGNSDDGA